MDIKSDWTWWLNVINTVPVHILFIGEWEEKYHVWSSSKVEDENCHGLFQITDIAFAWSN